MAYHRITIYMKDEDLETLDAVWGILDPGKIYSRSHVINTSLLIIKKGFERWQEKAAQQERNTADSEA